MSRAGYYAWLDRDPSKHQVQDDRLATRIRAIFDVSGGTYGSPRIHEALASAGIRVSRKRVVRLMQDMGLKARSAKVYRKTKGIKSFFAHVPNQVIDQTTTTTDQIWVADVTYLRAAGHWRYLAAVMDRHSRRVIGWRLGPRRDLKLTIGALSDAIKRRHPLQGTLLHSDRGAEYAAYTYRIKVAAAGLVQSMNRPGRITDNAFIESFFHSLKSEATHAIAFEDDESLRVAVTRFIRRYNRSRLHSSLGYMSPIDYERQLAG